MKALLDTNVALWAAREDSRLSARAKELLEDDRTALYFSVASLWELTIKTQIGKLTLPATLESLLANISKAKLNILSIHREHIASLGKLPLLHKDPFDRILVAQSLAEGMPIISSDRKIHQYSIQVIW